MAAEQTPLAAESKLKLIQMELQPATIQRLEHISEMVGAENGASAVATSIQIAEEVLKKIIAGSKLYVENPNGQRTRLTFVKTA